MRPLVGITTYAQEASWGVWRQAAALIPLDYVQAVERAGGRPVLIPPSEEGIDETLDALDAIVFSGGADVAPSLYGAEAHPETEEPHAHRDAGEIALMRAALERDVPMLAVCRGVQLLNVARGGDLHQHLPEVVGHEEHKHDPPGRFADHDVSIEPDTRLAEIFGARTTEVKSHHHQGVRELGEGLVVAALAEDGTVEAIEDPRKRFALGVLWHAEAGEDLGLFEALVGEAADYLSGASRSRRGSEAAAPRAP